MGLPRRGDLHGCERGNLRDEIAKKLTKLKKGRRTFVGEINNRSQEGRAKDLQKKGKRTHILMPDAREKGPFVIKYRGKKLWLPKERQRGGHVVAGGKSKLAPYGVEYQMRTGENS